MAPPVFRDKDQSKLAAVFSIFTFILGLAALVMPSWFRIRGNNCSQSFSLLQFFSFELQEDDEKQDFSTIIKKLTLNSNELPPCNTDDEILTLLKVLLVLCFMVLTCSSFGVVLNVMPTNSLLLRMIRRNAIPSILAVFAVMAIIGTCYYIFDLLDDNDRTMNVDYEYGFYTITVAGAFALMATASNLWVSSSPVEDDQRHNLMAEWEHDNVIPAVPSLPPYTPPEYNQYVPPLGAHNYYPFDDLSILPPPPPYTP